MSETRVLPGRPWPLGASWDGRGVNFALFSRHASAVELCLHPAPDTPCATRVALPERSDDVWHGYLPGLAPGALYAYRVHGEWAPERGHRFDPTTHVVDPCARALAGEVRWQEGRPRLPLGLVIDPAFDWEGDRPPRTPWSRTVVYECHVRGMTARHPQVPEEQRGRFLGLAHPAVIEHLRSLGITAVELMPVQQAAPDPHLARLGLPQYWGYGTLGFFAPDPRFASGALGEQVVEFKCLVKNLHRAGIEVILDVVYNHTPEGEPDDPPLAFRGIENAGYYRLDPADPARYEDFTGCGNTLDVRQPRVLQLILDSLRYWVREMHVDGFRFDLAPVLARDGHAPTSRARFFEWLRQDPFLADVKWIAEPWDLGPGGYQLGQFPYGWTEWNGRYRDCLRRFWRGDTGQLAELATRLSGSNDLFEPAGRTPQASLNYVTSHDGFTLADLVSYSRRHNEANGEQNRDGPSEDFSHNWGDEGERARRRVRVLRERARRNLLATLMLSLGVPMLSHGDELGRSQMGNNNAYCQDNELSWLDWKLDADGERFLAFARRVLELRRTNAVFRRRRFFHGGPINQSGLKDVSWLHPLGHELEPADWQNPEQAALGVLIPSESADPVDENGEAIDAETVLLLLNGSARTQRFQLPALAPTTVWREVLNTASETPRGSWREHCSLEAHALAVLVADCAP